jgi:hypothetical protein
MAERGGQCRGWVIINGGIVAIELVGIKCRDCKIYEWAAKRGKARVSAEIRKGITWVRIEDESGTTKDELINLCSGCKYLTSK